jgi:hypothetical protein
MGGDGWRWVLQLRGKEKRVRCGPDEEGAGGAHRRWKLVAALHAILMRQWLSGNGAWTGGDGRTSVSRGRDEGSHGTGKWGTDGDLRPLKGVLQQGQKGKGVAA